MPSGIAFIRMCLEEVMKKKRLLICMAAVFIFMLHPMEAFADEVPGEAKTAEELAAEEEKEKADSYAREIDTNKLEGWPQGPAVYADSAIVMDMDSKAILFSKNADAKHYPASITKLLTTLVALEHAELTDKVTFTEDSVSFLQYDDAQIGMKPGEELSMEDALHGVLLASANEVSYAVAESVGQQKLGGNYESFIQTMNDRAEELGCTGSHWANPNGLHNDDHYTTAHDMALIASAVYQEDEFQKIMDTLEYKIGPTNLTKEERVFQQNHKMLWPENYYYYEYCTGGKTGYTDQAKTTLVTMADNGDMRLAAVVLYDYGVDAYTDTRGMLDYVFQNFQKVSVSGQETSEDVQSFSDPDSYVVLPEGISFSQLDKEISLTEEGIRDGRILYSYKGQSVGSVDVTVTEECYCKLMGIEPGGKGDKEALHTAEKSKAIAKQSVSGENRQLKLIIAVGSVVIFVLIIFMYALKRRKKKALRHRKRAIRGRD